MMPTVLTLKAKKTNSLTLYSLCACVCVCVCICVCACVCVHHGVREVQLDRTCYENLVDVLCIRLWEFLNKPIWWKPPALDVVGWVVVLDRPAPAWRVNGEALLASYCLLVQTHYCALKFLLTPRIMSEKSN